ncbi:MAG: flagellar biosynthetic protein FliQ [Phycisphaerae bacterium]|nr:flagellar biosynthetic protein FliQ [Phycisphaerae bacterium]MBN8597051.1 flagellar biosynthetic protein FliQ [Planctomycetota bacterium]
MIDESMLEMVRQSLVITLKIAAPVLMAGIVIGLIISLIQAVTSIQDQTLSLVPKIVVMVIVAALLLPWILGRLAEYAVEIFSFSA